MDLEKTELYPLLFEPVYKDVLWGGTGMHPILNRPFPPDFPPVGEAWDICDRPNVSSAVINGPLAGITLDELLKQYGSALAGRGYRTGMPFPVMVKIIATAKPMSIHVHPNESFREEHSDIYCDPKTEMWYILHAAAGAYVQVNLKGSASRQSFMEHVHDEKLGNCLQQFASVPGDAYFIPGGRVHSMSGGNVVLEISQNSDTSFRIFDWDREDSDGGKRTLQIRNALDAINFTDRTSPRICGASNAVSYNRKYPLINRCPVFHCDELILTGQWRDDTHVTRSFHILTSTGTAFDAGNDRCSVHVEPFHSVLIPAAFGTYIVTVPEGGGKIIRTTL